jgi:E3 ubiquitin-protein ligase NEDD4
MCSTCFNRIDLPLFETKEELEEKLKLAVTMSATGFDIE